MHPALPLDQQLRLRAELLNRAADLVGIALSPEPMEIIDMLAISHAPAQALVDEEKSLNVSPLVEGYGAKVQAVPESPASTLVPKMAKPTRKKLGRHKTKMATTSLEASQPVLPQAPAETAPAQKVVLPPVTWETTPAEKDVISPVTCPWPQCGATYTPRKPNPKWCKMCNRPLSGKAYKGPNTRAAKPIVNGPELDVGDMSGGNPFADSAVKANPRPAKGFQQQFDAAGKPKFSGRELDNANTFGRPPRPGF